MSEEAAEARAAERARFLAGAGWTEAEATPLAGDASARRYWRLRGARGDAVLMDAAPETARAFAAVGEALNARGFSAPALLAEAADRGLLLVEDFGDALFARVTAERPSQEPALYEAAAEMLAALQAEPPPVSMPAPGGVHHPPDYDRATLLREARLALEWWAPAAGQPAPADAVAEFDTAVSDACAAVETDRSALVLLDYHAENLVWLPQRRGVARVGLLDHQDARRGAAAYDLVSLLEDARRDVSEAAAAGARAVYIAARGVDPEALAAAGAALAAQRNLKIVGLFARLAIRDGKSRYLSMLPRVWAHLERDLAYPHLPALASVVRKLIPPVTPETLARAAAAERRAA